MKIAAVLIIVALSGVLVMSPTAQPLPVNAPFTRAQLRAAARHAADCDRFTEALELLNAADAAPGSTVFVHFQGGHRDEVRGFATEAEAMDAINASK